MTTFLLIALNVAAFIAMKASGLVDSSWPDSCVTLAGVAGGDPGEVLTHPWSVVSYMFIHINGLHLLVNMLWLLAFGSMLEKSSGRRALLASYAAGGVAGAAVFAVAAPGGGYLIGSSAAVLAVAFTALCSGAPSHIEMPARMRRWLTPAAWVAAALLLLSQTDAISAHLAGMAAGVAIGAACGARHRRNEQEARMQAMNLRHRDSLLRKANSLGFTSLSASERQTLFEISSDRRADGATTPLPRQQ